MSTTSVGPYRPPQWTGPAMVSLTVTPKSTSAGSQVDETGLLKTDAPATTTYVFDAVLVLDHEQRLEKTRHPIQTGAAISDHAYLMPARVTLEVGMSDAMDSYASGAANEAATGAAIVQQWTGSASKSVSAYQTLISIQAARQPITLVTRLRTYTNMVILSVAPREDYRTITGLRCRVEFEQIVMASTVVTDISNRPDATNDTGQGVVSPTPVPPPTERQFAQPVGPAANVPGAGNYGSVPGQYTLPSQLDMGPNPL